MKLSRIIASATVAVAVSVLAPGTPGLQEQHEAEAAVSLLFIDYPGTLFDWCITACPDGAQDSEFCCGTAQD